MYGIGKVAAGAAKAQKQKKAVAKAGAARKPLVTQGLKVDKAGVAQKRAANSTKLKATPKEAGVKPVTAATPKKAGAKTSAASTASTASAKANTTAGKSLAAKRGRPAAPRTATARTSSAATTNVSRARKQTRTAARTASASQLSSDYLMQRRKLFDAMDDSCATNDTVEVERIAAKVAKVRCGRNRAR